MANETTNNNGYKNQHIQGDLSVSRNVNIGGNTTQQGSQHIKGNVKIEGWLLYFDGLYLLFHLFLVLVPNYCYYSWAFLIRSKHSISI